MFLNDEVLYLDFKNSITFKEFLMESVSHVSRNLVFFEYSASISPLLKRKDRSHVAEVFYNLSPVN